MNWNTLLSLGGMVMAGVAIGLHLGWLDGISASLVVYALMPYKPGR